MGWKTERVQIGAWRVTPSSFVQWSGLGIILGGGRGRFSTAKRILLSSQILGVGGGGMLLIKQEVVVSDPEN